MGILDELTPKLPAIDRLEQWLEARPPKERQEWQEAISQRKAYSSGTIARLLTAKGFPCDDNLVARYRRREASRVAR
jgi:hypothetical protein